MSKKTSAEASEFVAIVPRRRAGLDPSSVRLYKKTIRLGEDVLRYLTPDASPAITIQFGWGASGRRIRIADGADDKSLRRKVGANGAVSATQLYAEAEISSADLGTYVADLRPDGSVVLQLASEDKE